MLGGYKFIFFSAMDAIGHSRYLPLVIYEKGRPDHAAYIGNKMEVGEHHNRPFWTPDGPYGDLGLARRRSACRRTLRQDRRAEARIGIEPAFLPSDAYISLRKALPEATGRRCDADLRAACAR